MKTEWFACVLSLGIVGCSSSDGPGAPGPNNMTGGDDAGSGGGGDDSGAAADVIITEDAARGNEGGTTNCSYPTGPYSTKFNQGEVLSPNYTWSGYGPNGSGLITIHSGDFYDCDGTRGINAIEFDMSGAWCVPCQQEAKSIVPAMNGDWGKNGVTVVTLMWEDQSISQKATTDTALKWRNNFAETMIYVVADPIGTLASQGNFNPLPRNVLVDPRTMKIVDNIYGWSGSLDPAVLNLAMMNKK